jgi:nucleoside-diphosphate-sugar epimerase
MTDERVLVTGGAGFIGSHLVELLLESNYVVRVIDNLSSGHRDWVHQRAEFVEGDIRELEDCRKAMVGVRGVFHLAAMSRFDAPFDNIENCAGTNITGTQNVLIAAREAGVQKVVYSGCSSCYGGQDVPHLESMRPDFLNFHGMTKYAGEEYCLTFDKLYGVPAVVLRYFNVYGPRQPLSLVPSIFLQRNTDGLPLEIHGDGMQRRDFVHVRDVAAANLAAFERPVRGEAINIGSGTNVSLSELAGLISPRKVAGPRRKGDAEETLADISKAGRLLSWRPRVPFEAGLEELAATYSLRNLSSALSDIRTTVRSAEPSVLQR